MNLGANLRQKRLEAKLTQQELANKIGVTRAAISSWEVGRTEPSIGDVEKLSTALHCLKADIIGSDIIDYYEISNPDEMLLIEAYRSASEENKAFLRRILYYGNEFMEARKNLDDKK